MPSPPIQYRFATLLLWAALALVLNPVLHAFSHDHHEEVEDSTEHLAVFHSAEDELCPYCDAVTQLVAPATTDASLVPALLPGSIEPTTVLHPDLRLRLPTRLRAPPAFSWSIPAAMSVEI